jgi:hypothetical protein
MLACSVPSGVECALSANRTVILFWWIHEGLSGHYYVDIVTKQLHVV